MPVRLLFSVTFALGTVADEGSRTVPWTAEENCAVAGNVIMKASKTKRIPIVAPGTLCADPILSGFRWQGFTVFALGSSAVHDGY
jgi:hypothetical protein